MIELLMILSLSPLSSHTTLASKPFTTCQMPNKCAKVETAFQLAQYQPCVWPNTCSRSSESI